MEVNDVEEEIENDVTLHVSQDEDEETSSEDEVVVSNLPSITTLFRFVKNEKDISFYKCLTEINGKIYNLSIFKNLYYYF